MITVITPTYNRGYILENCYKSLVSQTNRDFIWMVIDDGSNDDTEQLISNWITEGIIKIQYIKKENGGKASALNVGIDNLCTEYVVCLDSDDIFYEHTIEIAEKRLNEIEEYCCGILALRHTPEGTVMGNRNIPFEYSYVTAADIFLKLNLKTEVICFYRSSILKKYRFPYFAGEKFVSPAWMQYEITQSYKFKTSWDKLCQCEYNDDGLTKNKKKIIVNNPKGYRSVKLYSFNLSTSIMLKIKHGIMYDCACILSKEKNWLDGVHNKAIAIILFPIAIIVKKLKFDKFIKG